MVSVRKVIYTTRCLGHFIFYVILAAMLSGCYTRECADNCCNPIMKCCLTGRRPQTIASYSTWVNDSTPPFGCDNGHDADENEIDAPDIIDCADGMFQFDEFKPQFMPVTPEMLDPFQKAEHNYRLAIGDQLEITVFGDEETTNEKVIVAPDGRIYYGVMEGIPCVGKTIQALRVELVSRLRRLYKDPIVSVIPVVVTGQTYTILGRVKKSGVYFIDNSVRLRDSIAIAGGFQEQDQDTQDRSDTRLDDVVDLSKSFIMRGNKRIDVDFERLVKTGDNDQNIFIHPLDYIYIAPMGVRDVYVLGNVIAPARVNYYKGITLMNALAYAGGWTVNTARSADLSKVLLIRGELEKPWVSCIDIRELYQGKALDIYLCPGDIIYVNNKTTRFGRELVRAAIYTYVQAFMTAWSSFITNAYLVPLPVVNTNTNTNTTSTGN